MRMQVPTSAASAHQPTPDLPRELWDEIFSLACTDTGTTGRSLSLTSKYLNVISKPYKYQSLGITQLLELINIVPILQTIPPEFRKIKTLCVVTEHVLSSVEDEEDEEYEPVDPESEDELECMTHSEVEGDSENEEGDEESSEEVEEEDGIPVIEQSDEAEAQGDVRTDAAAATNNINQPPPKLFATFDWADLEEADTTIHNLIQTLLSLCSQSLSQLILNIGIQTRICIQHPIIITSSFQKLRSIATNHPIQFNGSEIPSLQKFCAVSEGVVDIKSLCQALPKSAPNLVYLRIPFEQWRERILMELWDSEYGKRINDIHCLFDWEWLGNWRYWKSLLELDGVGMERIVCERAATEESRWGYMLKEWLTRGEDAFCDYDERNDLEDFEVKIELI